MGEKDPKLQRLLETAISIRPEQVGEVFGYRLKAAAFFGLNLSKLEIYPQDYEVLGPEAAELARGQGYRKALIVKDGQEPVAGIFGAGDQELLLYSFEPNTGKVFFLKPGDPHHLEVKNDDNGVMEANVTPQFKVEGNEYLSLIKIDMKDQGRIDYLFSVNPLGSGLNT